MSPSLTDSVAWVARGTDLFAAALSSLDDTAMRAPSALPDWSRAHVVAHVVGNARGLGNLVTWAATGVETPMYASVEQRNADIEAWAARSAGDLRTEFTATSAALCDGFAGLTEAGWSAEVRTIQGRSIPASQVPWLRSREVMIHAVDLDAGVGFEQMPEGFLIALIDDIVARRATMDGHPAIALEAAGQRWELPGEAPMTTVTGSLADMAAYLSGRGALGPAIPAWL